MKQGDPAKFIASTFGLAAFAIAVIAGMAAQNPADRVLGRALICFVICQVIGWILGSIGERAVEEAVDQLAASESPEPAVEVVLSDEDGEVIAA